MLFVPYSVPPYVQTTDERSCRDTLESEIRTSKASTGRRPSHLELQPSCFRTEIKLQGNIGEFQYTRGTTYIMLYVQEYASKMSSRSDLAIGSSAFMKSDAATICRKIGKLLPRYMLYSRRNGRASYHCPLTIRLTPSQTIVQQRFHWKSPLLSRTSAQQMRGYKSSCTMQSVALSELMLTSCATCVCCCIVDWEVMPDAMDVQFTRDGV